MANHFFMLPGPLDPSEVSKLRPRDGGALYSVGELRAMYVGGDIEIEEFEAGVERWMRAAGEVPLVIDRYPTFPSPDEATI